MRHVRLTSTSCNMLEEYYDHRAIVHFNPEYFSVTWDGGYGIEGDSGIFGFDLSSIPASAVFPVPPRLLISAYQSNNDAKMMVWGIKRHCIPNGMAYNFWGTPGQGEDRSWQTGGARGLLDRGSTYLGYWDPIRWFDNNWEYAELSVTQFSELPPYGFFQVASGFLYEQWYGVPPSRTFLPTAYLDVWYTDAALVTGISRMQLSEPLLTEGQLQLQRGGTTGRALFRVPGPQVHAFAAVESQSTPCITYETRNASTRALAQDDVLNHDVRIASGARSVKPYRKPRAVANCVGVFSVPLTKIELDNPRITLVGSTSAEGLELQPSHNVLNATTSGVVDAKIVASDIVLDANVYKVDNVRDAAIHLRQEIEDGYARGKVVDGSALGEDYGYEECELGTTVFCTTLKQRGTNGYKYHVIRIETGPNPKYWKRIKSSKDIGAPSDDPDVAQTKITLARALPRAVTVNDRVTVGGCMEPEA